MSDLAPGSAPGGRQRLVLHIGLPKSGTTYLQSVLAENRRRLKQAGFIYPFVRRECMFHAALELRELHEAWGLDVHAVEGMWQQLLDRVRAFGGTGVISHELLAGARPEHVERVARETAEFEVHVVVTARDLARQATAQWQEDVKNGSTATYAEFRVALAEQAELEEDTDHAELGFWRAQELPAVLERWSAVAPPERTHLVVVPRSGADPHELWRRYAAALGLDAGAVDVERATRTNESLATPQVALLREVVAALDGRLQQPHFAHVVKRWFAQTLLSGVDGPRPVTPPDFREELAEVAGRWVAEVRARGPVVHGDLDELLPAPADPAGRHPDEVGAEEVLRGLPDVLASMLLEVAELRTMIEGPRRLPPIAPPEDPQTAAGPAEEPALEEQPTPEVSPEPAPAPRPGRLRWRPRRRG